MTKLILLCKINKYLKKLKFRDSSAVEQSTVNRLVVGSNPTRGAKQDKARIIPGFIFVIAFVESRMRTWGSGWETGVSSGGGIGTEGFQGVNLIHDWFVILLAEQTPLKQLIYAVFWFIILAHINMTVIDIFNFIC